VFRRLPFAFMMGITAVAVAHGAGDRKGMTTEQHLLENGWWPRSTDVPRSDYVGANVCGRCHSDLLSTQRFHAMAHTSMPAIDAEAAQRARGFSIGSFQYSITPLSGSVNYTVSAGHSSITAPLLWAFGSGGHGQTFLFSLEGAWYETHISFFRGFGMGVTPGETTAVPASLADALGKKVPMSELENCFGCHATGAVTNNGFDPAAAVLGISCEGCHGPGLSHVAMASTADPVRPGMIMNPATLSPENSVDFCGSCHRTPWDVLELGMQGIQTVRFPAYRLEQSQCWGEGNSRITCVACHNPHKPLETTPSAYDAKCLACHVRSSTFVTTADHPARGCSVATANCVRCHMPKYTLPQMHAAFTDHNIRVVRDRNDFPDR